MRQIRNIVTKLSSLIEAVQYWLSLGIIGFLVVLIFIQIILRFVFSIPIVWSHEVASGLLIWLTFMGASILTKNNQHLRVDIISNMFSEKVNSLLIKVSHLLILFFSIFLIYFSYKLFNQQLNQMVGSLRLSKAYYFSLPVLVFGITTLIYSIETLISGEIKKDEITLL